MRRILAFFAMLLLTLWFATYAAAQDWEIPLRAVCASSAEDSLSYLGANQTATDGFDPAYDTPEPPRPPSGDWVALYFPHPEWGLPFDEFNSDVRAPVEEDSTKVWTFEVDINHSTTVELTWPDLSQVPQSYSLYLIRTSEGDTVNMRDSSRYSFSAVENTYGFQVSVTSPGAESITVISPNGGESWCVDSTYDVTWSSSGIANVSIEYSTDGGSSWMTIAASTPAAPGTYAWTVPNTPSADCKVRICDAADNDPCDQSDDVFTIEACDCVDPVHFVFRDNTSESYSIVADSAFLNCMELEDCDEIGVFADTGGGGACGDLCVGASVYHPNDLPIPLIAWKDDPLTDEIDGYSAGDTMYFRVWSSSQDSEECANSHYEVGNGYFETGFFSKLWLEGPCDGETVTVISPDGGEEWCVGSSENITWTSSGIANVKIEYSTDGGSSWMTIIASTPADPGTYAWTVPDTPSTNCLVNICDAEDGTPCDQSDAVFTIKAAPADPSDCVASDDLCDKVHFSWTDNSGDETGFYIYRDAAKLDSVGADVVSYDDLTATPGQTYSYAVSAYNDCGESSQCSDDGTRQAPPAAPSDCVASNDLCDKVSFTWTDNSTDETKFYIYRDGAKLDSVSADVESYDDLTAAVGNTYRYCVSAYNSCGESDSCCDEGTRQAPPAAPSDCVASEDLCDKVQFTWTDNSGDETGFYIYRDAAKLDSVGADVVSYDDLTATPGQTYSYGVSAYNDCGESSQCNDNGTRQAPPAAPSDCVASDDLCDKVQFSWTDNSADETGFIVYREGSPLDTVAAGIISYDDLTAAPGVTYNYCVSALNDCGESSQCCDNGTRQAPPVAPSGCLASDDLCDKVQFTWTDNSGDETGFYIYRDAAKLDSVGADVTTYDGLTATPGQTYTYGVSAYKDCGESSQCSDDGTRKAPPAAPSDCVASGDLCDRVQFCWTDNSGDETGFYIYRDAAKLDSVGADATCYFDFSATPGITYEYCVTAYNDCGESSQCCDNGSVVAEALTVTSPNGGENWTVGTSQSITWSFDCIDSVKIEYSTDNGSSWITEVEAVMAGPGSYSWTVPDAPSDICLVRICDAEDGGPCDQSDAVFTISTEVVEAVTVTAPNGGEVWCVGSTENITWTSTDIDAVKIEYSTDGGSSWTVEVASVPAAGGSYSWTVPDAPSTICLVRICDAEDGDPCDQSNALFTILGPPADPSACVASDDLCDKVQFTWTDNSGDETGFYIYRDAAKLDSVGAGVTSYNDLTAAPGMTYSYCVSAYNDCGESSQCCDDGTRQAPPDAPSACVASDDLCDRVQFTWTDNSVDEIGFYVYRDATKLDSVVADVTTYDDATATPGQTYSYCVSAYKDCGESSQCCDDGTMKDVPADPTGCLASDDDCDKVSFSWTDNSGNEDGFIVYRDGSPLDSVAAGVLSFDDLTASPGQTYNYCVTAYNECGESGRCCDNGSLGEESIAVTSPNGGESWRVGSTEDIEWICSCIDSVMLEYSTDAGANWTAIDSGIACGSETYSWTIPDTPSDDCLVRVSDDSDDVPADTSDFVFTIYRPGDMIYVDFDIKPGSCPNPLNTKSKGVLPVAILGTDEFDASDIDPAAVMLEGVSPLRWNWDDVSRPVIDPTDTCDCTTRGGDGYTDMTLKFDSQDIADALETQMPFADGETRILTITGMTYAGVPIEGTDCVRIIHKGQTRSSTGNLAGYSLGKNYPNPFNPETDISFTLPERDRACLTIYNIAGKKVKTLMREEMDAGTYMVQWDGTDDLGNPVASGVYLYRLQAGMFDQTLRMVLTK